MTGQMTGHSFISSRRPLVYLGGQKAAVSHSIEGWSAAGNLGASGVLIRMDDRTDGQRDDGTDGRRDGFRGSFISSRRPQPLSVRLQGKLHSSGFKGSFIRPTSGEAHQMDGFKGSFIWSASLFLYYNMTSTLVWDKIRGENHQKKREDVILLLLH
jgi:hypothetical protein